ncbi:PilZ domain-containing protein [Acidovorax sp.]|jgi:hypothetical protein|uniref:PilZ domain-containing protein n=1 Tax=Acidovorax sp. TaxID=1872122 RepID=UPI00391F8E0E
MPHERRHFVRVSFDAPALLTTARGAFSVHVVDVSLKGALLTAPSVAELSIGMPCQLTIPLAETGTHIAMSAEVAHLQDGATGLQCRSIDLDSVTHLRRLIELQLGNPSLIERDLAELTQASA